MKILYGFLILAFLVACEAENEEDLFAPPPSTMMMMDTTSTDTTGSMAVSFSSTIAPLIRNNCAVSGCHQANATFPTMETYAQIKMQADGGRIRARAVEQMTMPPSGRPDLTSQQISDLKEWLDNGEPNN